MATVLSGQLKNVPVNGPFGNKGTLHYRYVFAALPIADDVELGPLPGGIKVNDVRMVNAALGASTTVSLGHRNPSGASAASLLAATATNAVASTRMALAPVSFTEDSRLTATVGGAAATGAIDVIVDYELVGLA